MEVVGTNTIKDYTSVSERWKWLISSILLDDVFVHEILLIMDKVPSKKIETMGVAMEDNRIVLYYNLDFVNSLTDAEVRYVLKHETLHVALHHITTRLSEDPKERKLWNIAADLAVNSLITETSQCSMPKRKDPKTGEETIIGVLPSTYGFPEKLSMEQYVQLIRDKQDKNEEGEGEGGQGEGGEGQGNGQAKGGEGFDDHSGWEESEIGDEQIRQKIEQMANNPQAWGSMGADCKELILAAQSSKVPWTKLLRIYIGQTLSSKIASTFKRPNRRFGYPFSGTKRKYSDRKLLAFDTSASVGNTDLSQFLSEANRLAEKHPVDVCLFDCDITQEPKPFDKKHSSYEFKGRGGTNFEPPFKLASERGYKTLIVLTDGYAPAPDYPEGVKDVIWVITPDGQCPVSWGKQVKIDDSKS